MISICIPVRNAGAEFRDHLNRWKEQKCSEKFEIVVLDSGSEDSTVEIARNLGARVQTIPPTEFNHGESRNRLAKIARGDLLVFTVQDASPGNENTLAELTEPLKREVELVGVTGKQIPRPDANLIARWEIDYHDRAFNKGVRRKRMPPPKEFARLDFNQQLGIISFDNVCSAMRRSAWERFPFSPLDFAEDLDWSFRAMKAGHAILHNPLAQVHHSHNRSHWYRLKRYFASRYFLNRLLMRSPEDFLWSEEETFAAVTGFRLKVENLRRKLRQQSHQLSRLRLSRGLPYLFLRAVEKWGPEKVNVIPRQLPRQFPVQRLCGYFNFVCWEVSTYYQNLSPEDSLIVVDHAEAQVVGDFFAQCYYRCELMNCPSEEFARLAVLLLKYY